MRWTPGWGTALGAAALFALWRAASDARSRALSVAAGAMFFCAGLLASFPPEVARFPETACRYRGSVAEDPRVSDPGLRLLVDLEATAPAEPGPGWEPARGRILLRVDGRPSRLPARGDKVLFRGVVRSAEGFRNPGTLWYDLYLAREGIVGRAGAAWPGEVEFAAPAPGVAPLDRARRSVSEAMERAAPGQGSAVLRSIVVGDRSGIDAETMASFQRTGTIHLLSVGGLHLGIVILLAAWLLRHALVRWRRLALARPVIPLARLGALPAALFYTVVAGFYASTVRALIMAVIVVVGAALSRRSSAWGLLGATALAILIFQPLRATDPGLLLSLAALAGLFWFADVLRPPAPAEDPLAVPPGFAKRMAKAVGKTLASGVRAAAAATLMTAPLAAFLFGSGGWAGLLANPVAVPLVGVAALVLGLLGACVFPLSGTAAAFFWRPASALVDGVIAAQAALADALPAGYAGPFDTPFGVLGFYAVLTAFVFWRRQRPWRQLAAAGFLLMAFPFGGRWVSDRMERDASAWVLDVGAGQSAVFRLPGPQWVLVDGGGFADSSFDVGASVVWPALQALGCDRIDLAVSTHPHPDHVAGLVSSIRLGRARRLWLPAAFRGDARYGPLLAAASECGAQLDWVDAPKGLFFGQDARLVARPGGSGGENDSSLCVSVENRGTRFLVAADLEAAGQREVLAAGAVEPSAVLLAPHHGSGGAVDRAFFEAVRPGLILVSCGDRPGLPSQRLLEEGGSLGASLMNTRDAGAILVRFGKEGFSAEPSVR
jgi:competence protein ComEC